MKEINIGDKRLLSKMFNDGEIPRVNGKLLSVKLFKTDPDVRSQEFEEIRKAREEFFLAHKPIGEVISNLDKIKKDMENPKFITSDYALKSLVGKILTIVDSIGLNSKQETAVKDQIKGEFWRLERCDISQDTFKEIMESVSVTYYPIEKIQSPKELGYEN